MARVRKQNGRPHKICGLCGYTHLDRRNTVYTKYTGVYGSLIIPVCLDCSRRVAAGLVDSTAMVATQPLVQPSQHKKTPKTVTDKIAKVLRRDAILTGIYMVAAAAANSENLAITQVPVLLTDIHYIFDLDIGTIRYNVKKDEGRFFRVTQRVPVTIMKLTPDAEMFGQVFVKEYGQPLLQVVGRRIPTLDYALQSHPDLIRERIEEVLPLAKKVYDYWQQRFYQSNQSLIV